MTKLAKIIKRRDASRCYPDYLPGSDIDSDLWRECSDSTIRRYERLGWIEDRGHYILTRKGHDEN